jgi:ApbE superfamily uncharacterized protein (UPF0280 family)
MLPDGKRLHLQYGPTDMICEADGEPDEVSAAYRQAIARFRTVLGELVGELPRLRQPIKEDTRPESFRWSTARRMAVAACAHRGIFVTPMAAVAGAVADEILSSMLDGRRLERAYANNGGDIAIHLAEGAEFAIGLAARPDRPEPAGRFTITRDMPVGGVATSGRYGRSFSLGIADAVTVLAANAAAADVAATLIANAVDADHPAIERRPANSLDPDSDLGSRPVTVSVGPIDEETEQAALDAGLARAEAMREAGLIHGAALLLNRQFRVAGPGFDAFLSVPA